MVPSLALAHLINALTAVEMEESDLIKDFLQYNKHVLSALVVVKKLQIHAHECSGQGK